MCYSKTFIGIFVKFSRLRSSFLDSDVSIAGEICDLILRMGCTTFPIRVKWNITLIGILCAQHDGCLVCYFIMEFFSNTFSWFGILPFLFYVNLSTKTLLKKRNEQTKYSRPKSTLNTNKRPRGFYALLMWWPLIKRSCNYVSWVKTESTFVKWLMTNSQMHAM